MFTSLRSKLLTAVGVAATLSTVIACGNAGSSSDSTPADETKLRTVAVRLGPCGVPSSVTRAPAASVAAAHSRAVRWAAAYVDSLKQSSKHDDGRRGARIRGVSGANKYALRLVALFQRGGPGAAAAPQLEGDRIFMDSLHKVSFAARRALGMTMGMTEPFSDEIVCGHAASPEFQDAQRLVSEDSTFGPLVQVITPPTTEALKTAAQFNDKKVLVALAEVTLDSGMTTTDYAQFTRYAKLHLSPGINCIFLQRTNARWSAFIAPEKDGCAPSVADNAQAINVYAGPDELPDSIPASSRIVEGRQMTPFIGVRCGRAWCVIGARSADDLLPPVHLAAMNAPGAPPATIRTRLAVWFDEQHLAVRDDKQGKLIARFRASIIPDAGLIHRTTADYDVGWVPVGYVFASTPVPAKYATRFGYHAGWNRLLVRRDKTQPDTLQWSAMIVNADDYTAHVRRITNFQHTFGNTPGTARWAWNELDEWVWIPCDNGCCLVQDGLDAL